jgi:superfamily II DNA or RNA helicase
MLTLLGYHLNNGSSRAEEARRELSVTPTSTFDIGIPTIQRPISLYKKIPHEPNWMAVPIRWASMKWPDEVSSWIDARPMPKRLSATTFRVTLLEDLRQPQAVESVLKTMHSSKGGGGALLCLPTGYGKTTVALAIAHRLGFKTVVLVHKALLMDQWTERVKSLMPGLRVTVVKGDVCDVSGDIVVVMIQTLVSRGVDAFDWEGVGFVIIDECHHIAAATFSSVIFGLQTKNVLGLSATPTRKDGLTHVLEWIVGPVACVVERKDSKCKVRIVRVDHNGTIPENRFGKADYVRFINDLVEDTTRNEILVRNINSLAEMVSGRILVLTHRREHAKTLARLISKTVSSMRASSSSSRSSLITTAAMAYIGGMKSVPFARIIVSTFSLCSEGFDLPALKALALTTPTGDITQAIGRIMRGSATAEEAVVLDFMDTCSLGYSLQKKRQRTYASSGCLVSHGPMINTHAHTTTTASAMKDIKPLFVPEASSDIT